VFTLVADKLERPWLPEVCYAQFTLQPHYTDNFQNVCEKTLQMNFKVAVRNFYAFIVQAGDSLTDALRVVSVLWLLQLTWQLRLFAGGAMPFCCV